MKQKISILTFTLFFNLTGLLFSQTTTKYYIIEGSYPTEADALNKVEALKTKGYSGAEVVDKNQYGYYRVSYQSYVSKETAVAEKDKMISGSIDYDAWVYSAAINSTSNTSSTDSEEISVGSCKYTIIWTRSSNCSYGFCDYYIKFTIASTSGSNCKTSGFLKVLLPNDEIYKNNDNIVYVLWTAVGKQTTSMGLGNQNNNPQQSFKIIAIDMKDGIVNDGLTHTVASTTTITNSTLPMEVESLRWGDSDKDSGYYKGQIINRKPDGKGKLTYDKGDVYDGFYKEGKMHGDGTYTWASGNKYVGVYQNDKRNGYGTYTWQNGDIYAGQWVDGKRNGQGTLTDATGKYVGEWKDGKKNGKGIATDKAGNKYEGEYKDDIFNGKGSLTAVGGDKYEGDFKDGKFNGLGTATFNDGNKYVGEFKDGNLDGQGTATYNNGDKYVGSFKNNKQNGYGTYYFSDGTIQQGMYKDGEFNGN